MKFVEKNGDILIVRVSVERLRAAPKGAPRKSIKADFLPSVLRLSGLLPIHAAAASRLNTMNVELILKVVGKMSSKGGSEIHLADIVSGVANYSPAAAQLADLLKRDFEEREVVIVAGGSEHRVSILVLKDTNLERAKNINVLSSGSLRMVTLAQKPEATDAARAEFRNTERYHHGTGLASGFGVGRVYIWATPEAHITRYEIPEDKIETEVKRFEAACVRAKDELTRLADLARTKGDSLTAQLMETHRVLVEGLELEVPDQIRRVRLNAEHMVADYIREYSDRLRPGPSQGEEFIHILDDFADIQKIVLQYLNGNAHPRGFERVTEPIVVVATDIRPQDLAELHAVGDKLVAIVTEHGGPTSHASIIARSRNIPAVVLGERNGQPGATRLLPEGKIAAVSGAGGVVIMNPSDDVLAQFRLEATRLRGYVEAVERKVRGKLAETLDRQRVTLLGNADHPAQCDAVRSFEGDGVGLLRSEFIFMDHPEMPTEDELTRLFLDVPEKMDVTLRIADFGGDKMPASIRRALKVSGEQEFGFMGLRGMRLYFHNAATEAILLAQVRAALRASGERPGLKIMFPMVSGIHTMRRIHDVIRGAKSELSAERVPFNDRVPIGSMVELPSTVQIIDDLMKEVDFVSVGTNDLIQYTLGVDRGAATVSRYYDPFHPAVLRQLARLTVAAKKAKKDMSICGDMASDPLSVLVMMGMGVRRFSAIPTSIPMVKYLVRSVRMEDAQKLARGVLRKIGDLQGQDGYDKVVHAEVGRIFEPGVISILG